MFLLESQHPSSALNDFDTTCLPMIENVVQIAPDSTSLGGQYLLRVSLTAARGIGVTIYKSFAKVTYPPQNSQEANQVVLPIAQTEIYAFLPSCKPLTPANKPMR